MGRMDPYKTSSGANVAGAFFGQSSFSKFAIASESSVVNVEGLVKGREELKLFAPLGCGLQTGAASVLNRAQAKKGDSVAVIGLGGVVWLRLWEVFSRRLIFMLKFSTDSQANRLPPHNRNRHRGQQASTRKRTRSNHPNK
jgi:hypothetical protein